MKLSISKKILLLSLLPCLLIGIIVSVIGSNVLEQTMTDEIEKQLHLAAYSLVQHNAEGSALDEQIVDYKAAAGVDLTVFEGDVRVYSTVDGAVGTTMDPAILASLQSGEDYFATNANVNGVPYFGYYIPVMTNGTYTGAMFSGVSQEAANQEIKLGVSKLASGIVIVSIILCIVAIVLVRRIVKTIGASKGIIDELSTNNLEIEYDHKYERNNDEIEEIYNEAYHFAENIKGIVKDIKSASATLNGISTELSDASQITNQTTADISKAMEDVAEGATNQASETQGATEMVAGMGTNIETIQTNTQELAGTAQNMNVTKEDVLQTMNTLEKTNQEIIKDVDSANEQIKVTNDSVATIQRSLELIKSIADQTNLLSLNASIEAARAGEAGRGFAVVAGEISNLAQESTNSSAEIEKSLNELLENYELIVEKMNVTTDNINEQNEKLIITKQTFATLEDDIDKTINKIEEIEQMVEALNEERNSIIDTISNLSAISQENAASTEETMASIEELNQIVSQVEQEAHSLHNVSEELLQKVSIFRTE